jgi:hypothetical protein
MPKSTINVTPKKRGRPATGQDPFVTTRMPQHLIDAVAKWASTNEVSRSEAIRQLVEIALQAKTPAPRKR